MIVTTRYTENLGPFLMEVQILNYLHREHNTRILSFSNLVRLLRNPGNHTRQHGVIIQQSTISPPLKPLILVTSRMRLAKHVACMRVING